MIKAFLRTGEISPMTEYTYKNFINMGIRLIFLTALIISPLIGFIGYLKDILYINMLGFFTFGYCFYILFDRYVWGNNG